jgi:hypothetical protein
MAAPTTLQASPPRAIPSLPPGTEPPTPSGAPSSVLQQSPSSLQQLCDACAEVSSLRASIVLGTESHPQAAMAASDGAAEIEEFQLTLGEGPGIDAQADACPVLVEDLSSTAGRWTQFVPAAQGLGVGAAFAFPLQVGAIRTGVLCLYASLPYPLSASRLRDLTALAGMVSDVVLAMQSAVAMEELAWSLSRATEHRSVVHQATGMVSVQLDSSMQDAFATLRSRAFTESVGVDEIAQRVVERMLRFDL